MKKIMLLLIGLLSMLYGVSFGYIQSEQYNSKNTCENVREKNNKLYPSYIRSNCYSKDGYYYYNICQKGEDCNISVSNTNTENLSSDGTGNNKPYYIQDKKVIYKEKLDSFLGKLVKLKDTKYNGDIKKYLDLLDGIIGKLNKLEPKYKNNDKITSIISYLEDGISLIKEHVKKEQADKTKEDDINSFFCDLQGGCNKDKTSTSNDIIYSSGNCMLNTGLRKKYNLNDKKYLKNGKVFDVFKTMLEDHGKYKRSFLYICKNSEIKLLKYNDQDPVCDTGYSAGEFGVSCGKNKSCSETCKFGTYENNLGKFCKLKPGYIGEYKDPDKGWIKGKEMCYSKKYKVNLLHNILPIYKVGNTCNDCSYGTFNFFMSGYGKGIACYGPDRGPRWQDRYITEYKDPDKGWVKSDVLKCYDSISKKDIEFRIIKKKENNTNIGGKGPGCVACPFGSYNGNMNGTYCKIPKGYIGMFRHTIKGWKNQDWEKGRAKCYQGSTNEYLEFKVVKKKENNTNIGGKGPGCVACPFGSYNGNMNGTYCKIPKGYIGMFRHTIKGWKNQDWEKGRAKCYQGSTNENLEFKVVKK